MIGRDQQQPILRLKRIGVGYVGLYPTLLIVLSLLQPLTQPLGFAWAVLIEVLVLVPITQLIAYPLANHLLRRWL